MQAYTTDGTRLERTGWRDQEISRRHRSWGFNCPAVDLDFLMVEYNMGLPVGLIEYKHHLAHLPDLRHATYRALCDLADGYKDGGLPFLVAFYWPEIWAFRVLPVNRTAQNHFAVNEELSEYDFVSRLYRLRRLVLTSALEKSLHHFPVPEEW